MAICFIYHTLLIIDKYVLYLVGFYGMMVANFFINFILNKVCSQRAMKNSTFASFSNSIIALQFLNGGKMIKWKVGAVEKCPRWRSLWVEIVPFSALYYKIHTISILQVRKLVIQVTSTSTSTIYK